MVVLKDDIRYHSFERVWESTKKSGIGHTAPLRLWSAPASLPVQVSRASTT